MKFPEEVHTCHRMDMIEFCVKEVIPDMWPCGLLEHCIVSSSSIKNEICTFDCGDDSYARDEEFMHYIFA